MCETYAEQQELTNKQPSVPDDLFYMKQTIGNACGTIGILHALGNQQHLISFGKPGTTRSPCSLSQVYAHVNHAQLCLSVPVLLKATCDDAARHQELSSLSNFTLAVMQGKAD